MSNENTPTPTPTVSTLTKREVELAVAALQSLDGGSIKLDMDKFVALTNYANVHSASVHFSSLKKKLSNATKENYFVASPDAKTAKATPQKGGSGKTNPKSKDPETPTKHKASEDLHSTSAKRTKKVNHFKKEDQDEEVSATSEPVKDEEV
ncbi:MAG: hypothetical protein Q9200_005035 [Gallowayella weberi]